jgi:ATP adenylyltransferase
MMKPMFAPWRMTYIKSEKPDGCVFCKDSIRSDDLVLLEGESAFVMLNRYP